MFPPGLFDLTKEAIYLENLLFGLIAGLQTITSNPICIASSQAFSKQIVVVLDNRFGLFMPDYSIKLQNAWNDLVQY